MSARRTWDDAEVLRRRAEEEKRREGEDGEGDVAGEGEGGEAAARAQSLDALSELVPQREEFRPAGADAARPEGVLRGGERGVRRPGAFLSARTERVDLHSKVGQVEVIGGPTATAASIVAPGTDSEEGQGQTEAGRGLAEDGIRRRSAMEEARAAIMAEKGAGFFCEVCQCVLKDSSSYLSHINGRKHLDALGYGNKVQRSTVEEVVQKLQGYARQQAAARPNDEMAELASASYSRTGTKKDKKKREKKRKKEERKRGKKKKKRKRKRSSSEVSSSSSSASSEGEEPRAQTEDDAEEARRRARVEAYEQRLRAQAAAEEEEEQRRRARKKQRRPDPDDGAAEEAVVAEGVDPQMAAILGFSGFGGSKKR